MLLDKDRMINLLAEFGEILKEMGSIVTIDVYGGAAMSILYSNARVSEDIDVMLGDENYFEFKEVRNIMAQKHGLNETWINDAIAGVIAFDMKSKKLVNYGVFGNLYINIVSAEQLLAMKLFSSRDNRDFEDAVSLAKHLKLSKKKEFNKLLVSYFKDNSIKKRNRIKSHYNGISNFIDNLVEFLNGE